MNVDVDIDIATATAGGDPAINIGDEVDTLCLRRESESRLWGGMLPTLILRLDQGRRCEVAGIITNN